MKNREPRKADSTGGHLKVAFDRVPGPGARTFCAKIMRRLPFHGPGGHPNCGMSIAECGLKKKNPKSEIRNSKSEIQMADPF
jgi:hypothetical protein